MLKSVNEIGKHLDREVTWCEHDFTTVTNFMPVISVTTLNTKSLLFKVKHTGQNIIFIVHLRYKFLLSLNEFSRKVFGGGWRDGSEVRSSYRSCGDPSPS